MKKAFAGVISAILFFLFACNDSTSTNTSRTKSDSSSMSSAKVIDKSDAAEKNMKAVYKGIETGDMSAMDSFCDKNLVDHSMPAGEVKGLDSIKNILADIHNHITDLKIVLISCSANDDYVFTLSRMTGKAKDASMGVPANTAIDNTSVDVVKVVNGKSTDHWDYERSRPMAAMHDKGHKGKM